MKELLALVALVTVLGFGALLYRNTLEHPGENTNRAYTQCTTEARICPDGTAVGRTGLACEFAACPFPNVEIPTAGISYTVPAGFSTVTDLAGESLIAAYAGNELSSSAGSAIRIYRYLVPEGQTANDVALATATADDGTLPESMLGFSPVIVNGTKVETIDLGSSTRARTAHYLLRETDVIRFDAIDVRTDAAASSFMVPAADLPAHRALIDGLLASLQVRN
jgi:hypothetical protein